MCMCARVCTCVNLSSHKGGRRQTHIPGLRHRSRDGFGVRGPLLVGLDLARLKSLGQLRDRHCALGDRLRLALGLRRLLLLLLLLGFFGRCF